MQLLPKFLFYALMNDFEKNFGDAKGKFTMANMTTAMTASATCGVACFAWAALVDGGKKSWRPIANITRAPAFMQDSASAKKLNIAPAESSGYRKGTWYIVARTFKGASI